MIHTKKKLGSEVNNHLIDNFLVSIKYQIKSKINVNEKRNPSIFIEYIIYLE